MVVSDKIEAAKNCFNTIKTSGRNNYQKYDYLETRDIFPLVRKVCEDFKMKTNIKPDFELNCFVLTITDKEDNSSEQFFVPYAQITAGDAGKFMQDFGRCQTYAMKYLYIQAFEIAVLDEIDNKDQKKQVPKQKKQPTPKKQVKQEPKEDATPMEVSEERVKEILDKAYATVTLDAGKEFNLGTALWTLKRLCENDEELRACKDALKLYTADKVKQ
jgi:hypothetical protein